MSTKLDEGRDVAIALTNAQIVGGLNEALLRIDNKLAAAVGVASLAPENAPKRPAKGPKESKTSRLRAFSWGAVFWALRKAFCAENGLLGSSRRCDRGAGRALRPPKSTKTWRKTVLKAFKEFAMKGNVVDMEIGINIGGAFGKIVSPLVETC